MTTTTTIKKAILKVTYLTMLCTSLTISFAQAEFIPGWQRPLKMAKMKIISEPNRLTPFDQVTLTLTHQDGITGSNPTGMILDFINFKNNKTSHEKLSIENVKIDPCGSAEYTAIEPVFLSESESSEVQSALQIVLIDHSQRTTNSVCDDVSPDAKDYSWELQIKIHETVFTAKGNPHEVVTIED